MSSFAIGIDLGGTRIKTVAIDSEGNELAQLYLPTNDGNDENWKNTVKRAVSEVVSTNEAASRLQGKKFSIGISAPGLPDENNSCIAFMPGRLQGLENCNWTDLLQHPCYVLNDAVAALMAEARFGAAKGQRHVVMLTLGTGVGGAILIDGKPYQGAFNKAGHIGHMVINSEGEPDITGMPGSLEDCIGNASISQRSNGKYSSTSELLQDYRKGDSHAKEIWLTSVRMLAIGLASITNILSPDMIILGGGISECGNDLFMPLNDYMNLYEWRAGGHGVSIVKAKFGDLAGAIGAAAFAMDKIEK